MKAARITPKSPFGHAIDHRIFGCFIEHAENCIQGGILDVGSPLSDAAGIRQDVLQLCRELAPTLLRFPGGTVIGTYHWEDHVGPLAQRKVLRNLVWGGMLAERFGTCEFVAWCRQIGAEPMLCVNMPSGSPEEAARWVEYCNGTGDSYYAALRKKHGYPEPFRVRYWCIGNESYSVPDLGAQNDVDQYIRQAWEYAKYMKMVDPEIELIFVGNPSDMAWNRAVMASLGEICDYLSIHFYARSQESFGQLRAFESRIQELRGLLAESNGREMRFDPWYRIPSRQHETWLALDEWNIWDGKKDERSPFGLQQRYTWQDALWTAEFLNMMIRNGDLIRIGNLAQLVNVLSPIITEPEGAWKQTIFVPFAMYANHCGETWIPCEAEGEEDLDFVLTGGADGVMKLFAVNRSRDEIWLDLSWEARTIRSYFSESLLAVNNAEKDCVQWEEHPTSGKESIILPPGSLNLIF